MKISGEAIRIPTWPEAYRKHTVMQKTADMACWIQASIHRYEECCWKTHPQTYLIPRIGAAQDVAESMHKCSGVLELLFVSWKFAAMIMFDFSIPGGL